MTEYLRIDYKTEITIGQKVNKKQLKILWIFVFNIQMKIKNIIGFLIIVRDFQTKFGMLLERNTQFGMHYLDEK